MNGVIKKGAERKQSIPAEQREPHQEVKNSRYQAARMEGKVQNLGIKNLGKQARKGKKGGK
jgi:hypothetical protein